MKDEKFSIKARTKSFEYAFSGIKDFIITPGFILLRRLL